MKRTVPVLAVFCLLCVALASPVSALNLQGVDYVVDNNTNRKVPIPSAFEADRVIDWFGQFGALNAPEDLFFDGEGNLYIADTGNNRILKIDKNGEAVMSFGGTEDRPLKSPRGVFVDDRNDIYVADAGNERILHVTQQGEFVEEFVKPVSDLISGELTFDPSKIAVSRTGYIYLLKGQQFMTLDEKNNFRGYVGSNVVPFNFVNMLIRVFASKEQKRKLSKETPAPYSNFLIHTDGMIYATGVGAFDQIKIINSVGTNIFPAGVYGEYSIDPSGAVAGATFADIAVDQNGIITVIDQNTSKLYQYDQNGSMLCVFGGKGETNGFVELPSSIAINAQGDIYVLDKAASRLQVYKPTSFIRNVHTALYYFNLGQYETANAYWGKVADVDANYGLALAGLGKFDYETGNFSQALEYYRRANDKAEYSTVFNDYRQDIIKRHFTPIVLAGLASIVALIVLGVLLKRKSDRLVEKMYDEKVKEG